jgi:hypothetical protein
MTILLRSEACAVEIRPASDTPTDIDAIPVRVTCSTPEIGPLAIDAFFFVSDLNALAGALRDMNEHLGGEARIQAVEDQVWIRIQGDRGQFEVVVKLTWPSGQVTAQIQFPMDQTFLKDAVGTDDEIP